MSELQEALIEVYASGSVDEVHASPAYQKLCRRHEGDRAFDGERATIEEIRRDIDKFLRNRDSYKKQVEFALRLLHSLRNSRQAAAIAACQKLILETYGAKWTELQRQYFEKRAVKVVAGSYYFLSFTNRNPNKPAQNLINRTHRHFIIDAIGQSEYDKRDHSTENLAALAIHCLLTTPFPGGFYFPAHVGDSQEIATKLKEGCEHALAFVQLVQQQMFTHDPNSGNWCHQEYSWAWSSGVDRILFVQLEDEIREDTVWFDWRESWYCFFSARDPLRLQPTRWLDPQVIDANIDAITERLKSLIEGAINRIYLEIPA